MQIGIVVIGTNNYLILAIRFIKNFLHYYKGNANIKFYLFCDDDPYQYLSAEECKHVKPFMNNHSEWRDGTNAKFNNILRLQNELINYIYYFDADTDVSTPFTEEWFIGDMVAGEHFLNWTYTEKDIFPFDYHISSSCFVDLNLGLPKKYYYGAFFGGKRSNMIKFARKLAGQMEHNKRWNHEPPWNDESYINAEFHYNPPTKVVATKDFPFCISNKGMKILDQNRMPPKAKKTWLLNKGIKDRCKRKMRKYKDTRWEFEPDDDNIRECE